MELEELKVTGKIGLLYFSKCPNCGNYGMNYMTSGLGSRMFGYTLADLCIK